MDLLRRNLFFIICGLVAGGGAYLGYRGISDMPQVLNEMNEAKSLYQAIDGLKTKPVNRDGIDREQQRIDSTQEDLARIKEKANALRTFKPLTPDAFPDGDDEARRSFQKAYAAAMQKLFDDLKSGQPATDIDARVWATKIDNEKFQAREKGLDAGAEADPVAPAGPPRTPSGVLTKDGAKGNAMARANMAIAQKHYCYAVPIGVKTKSKVPSLDFHVALQDTGTVDAPEMEAVWNAQLGYWIQRDVVKAIVATNQEASAEARKRGEDGWIGNMPVKDVISIRVSSGYVMPDAGEFAGAPPGGYGEALPPETGETTFTGSVSTEHYEVMQFTVKLVMDQRDIPRLIDNLTTNSFYTVLRAAYQVAPPNVDMVGKIYGPEPNVNVVMDFEAIMPGDVFRPMMPLVACELLAENGTGIQCPEPEEDTEDEG